MLISATKRLLLTFSFLMLAVSALLAQVAVTGRVTDASGKALAGATVSEKNSRTSVNTDSDGRFRIPVSSPSAVLVVTYVGYLRQEMALGGKNSRDFVLAEDASELSQVTVTASRQPIRKLEATQSVEIINSRTLKAIKPEGIAEAITSVPGLYVNTSQGRRGAIVTRGFPDGGNPLGGLDYTAILLDGLPSFGTTGRLPEAGFGFDANVDRVEVVRGSAATLFGRASAAGAVNVISRTGGSTLGGTVKLTNYNNVFDEGRAQFNYRTDFNVNGPLTKDKNLRFNIGGWYMNDNGFKNTGYNDKGYQFRGNFDYLLKNDRGNIRVYFLAADYIFQNLTDIPADLSTMRAAGGYTPWQTLQNFKSLYDLNYTVYESGAGYPTRRVTTNGTDSIYRSIRSSMNDNSYGNNFHVGTNFNLHLGSGFYLEEKFRYQNLKSGTKYSFALPSFYRSNSMTRLLLDGDSKDRDIMNEFRLRKKIETGRSVHNLVLGNFFSTVRLTPVTYSFLHVMNPENASALAWAPLAPPFVNVPWSGSVAYPRGSITRQGIYDEQVVSIFGGDEIKFNDRFTLNLGARYDWVKIDMQENKRPYDSTMYRNVTHKDWSASIGFNYLVNEKSALYGSFNRAFRAPDYTAYTSLEFISRTNPTFLRAPGGINKNEVVINSELGYRTTIDDVTFDIAGFHTKINNRLASIFENGIVVSKPFGSNRIYGGEFSFTYMPSFIKGFIFRSNLTLQRAIFTEFKIPVARGGVIGNASTALNVNPAGNLYGNKLVPEANGNYSIDVAGNKLPGVPGRIFNMSASYLHKWFGLDYSFNHNGNRYADPTEILKYPDLNIVNAGAFVRVPLAKTKNEVRIGLQAKNLTSNQVVQNIAGLGASDLALGQYQATPQWVQGATSIWGQGYIQIPRRWLFYMEFNF
jgi:outer membrane receptor protein involved in Fe transport